MRAEAMATAPVVALHRAHQADVALLNQVEQREATPHVALGDADDQAEVRQHELLDSLLVARLDALGKVDLLRVTKHRHAPDLAEVARDPVYFPTSPPLPPPPPLLPPP